MVGGVLQLVVDGCVILWTVGDRLRSVYRTSTTSEARELDRSVALRLGAWFLCGCVVIIASDLRAYTDDASAALLQQQEQLQLQQPQPRPVQLVAHRK